MKVNLIFRKTNPIFFSIEKVFEITAEEMSKALQLRMIYLPKVGVKLANLIYLYKLSREHSADAIYHVTGDIHYAVFALPRRRTVLTIHDCVFLENHTGIKRYILKKLLLDWPVRYVSIVTAISEKTRQEIIYNTGCLPDKIKVINNPVSPHIYRSFKVFNTSKPVLLFVGSTANKNLDRAIEAVKGLSCVLHIIGVPTAAQFQKLKDEGVDYLQEKGLTEKELADRYSACDIIYFPTLYEGFGLPIIEGFKAGKAVLTSNLSPMKDIAESAAFLVDPYNIKSIRDGIVTIIDNEEERNQKCREGRKIAEKYEASRISENYIEIYKSVMK